MEDLVLYFFSLSNQSADNFFLLWFLFFFLLISVRFFLTKKWLQLYKDVYSKYIFFEEVGTVPGSLSSLKENRLSKIVAFFVLSVPLYFLFSQLILMSSISFLQLSIGFLLAEIYILLDFLFGIFLFLFIRRHVEDISGTAYFKKNIVTALRIFSMSQRFLYFLLLTIIMPTYYMYGLLLSLGLNYVSTFVFGYVSRVE